METQNRYISIYKPVYNMLWLNVHCELDEELNKGQYSLFQCVEKIIQSDGCLKQEERYYETTKSVWFALKMVSQNIKYILVLTWFELGNTLVWCFKQNEKCLSHLHNPSQALRRQSII